MRRVFPLFLVLSLAGCSGPRLPFEKEGAATVGAQDLIHPPWEALVKAGPGADQELDLETLNGPGGQLQPPPPLVPPLAPPPVSLAEEEVSAPPPTLEPVPAKTSGKKLSKNAVTIRAVAVPTVGGQGGAELTAAMRDVLRESGWPVVAKPAADALTIRGTVSVGAAKGGAQTVKLRWVVATPDGKVLGDLAQSNDIPEGSLAAGWGENARFAAEAAAEGIFSLIQKYR